MEVDVGVHHHEHQIVDSLVIAEFGERGFDGANDIALFGEGLN